MSAPPGHSFQLPPMVQEGSAYGGRGPTVLAVALTGLAITTILIAGRVYLRVAKGVQKERKHDIGLWFTLFSWFTAVVATVLITISVAHGLGNHTRNLSLPNIIEAGKLQWISVSLAAFSSGTSKVAVVAFLLGMQDRSTLSKQWSWMLYFLAVTNVALNFAIVFIIIFQCTPVEATWNFTIRGQCFSRDHLFGPVGITQTCWNALTDVVLAIYPSFIVFRLQISLRLKSFLVIIMGLGVVAGAFALVKLPPLLKLIKAAPQDPMYEISIIVIWGQVELWIVLIALSIPPIWPLVKPFFKEISTKIQSSGKSKGPSRGTANSKNWEPIQNTTYMDGSKAYNMPFISTREQSSPVKVETARPKGIRSTIDINVTYTNHPGFGSKEAQDHDHLLK